MSKTEPSPNARFLLCHSIAEGGDPVAQLGTEAAPSAVVDGVASAFTRLPSFLPTPGSPGVSSGFTPGPRHFPSALRHSLTQMGQFLTVSENQMDPERTNIELGWDVQSLSCRLWG